MTTLREGVAEIAEEMTDRRKADRRQSKHGTPQLMRRTGFDRRRTGAAEEDLDEMVHDLKSAEAAEINNQGREAQLDYING